MSKIKLQGHASGSGIFTLTSANSNTDRTISLPDATATLATTTDVAARLPSITDGGNATAITIDSAENIGIGVTPETGWRSSAVGLDIGDGGAIAGYDGASGAMQILSNSYWNTSGGSGWKYKNSSYPATLLNCDGEFAFKTAGNGTADNAITWTTPLEIKADGRGLSQFTAKAWLNVNQTSTQAIRDSHNVSSISDNGTGQTILNFANNMADVNYAAVATAGGAATHNALSKWNLTPAVGSFVTGVYNSQGNDYADSSQLSIIVFGD